MKLPSLVSTLTLAGTAALADGHAVRIIPEAERDVYETVHYAPAVVMGNDIYMSGVSGQTFDGENAVEQQFEAIFARVAANLEAAGSNMAHVKEVYTWHVDMFDHGLTFLKVKDKYFPGPDYPTFTSVGIDALPPGALLEVTVRAERIDGGDALEYRDAPGKAAAELKYAPAVVDDDLIYLSGLAGDASGSVEEQFRSAFDILKAELEAAGSSLNDIIELDSFHVDASAHMALFEQIRDEYITAPVVWNPVPIKAILVPGGLLELTARARPTDSETRHEVTAGDAPNLARAIRYGNDVFIATVMGIQGETDSEKFTHALEQLQASVAAAGLEMADVVEFNSFMTDMTPERFLPFLSLRDQYLKEPYPTWNGLGVGAFADPDAIIAISARAHVAAAQ